MNKKKRNYDNLNLQYKEEIQRDLLEALEEIQEKKEIRKKKYKKTFQKLKRFKKRKRFK